MDPTQALKNLIEALQSSNFHAADESADALAQWHERGGFLPRWPESVEDPTGPGAWHLGRLVMSIDLESRLGYVRALAALEALILKHVDRD